MEGFNVNDKFIFFSCRKEWIGRDCKTCKQKINKTIQKVLKNDPNLHFWFCWLKYDEVKYVRKVSYRRINGRI